MISSKVAGGRYFCAQIHHPRLGRHAKSIDPVQLRALRPNGRVVLIEVVVSDDDRPSWAPLMDLNMLALLPGCERTAREYQGLLGRAGLCLDCITPTATRFSFIEASGI